MSKMTLAWVEAQIEQEMERGNKPEAVQDLASLVIVRDYLSGGQYAVKPLEAMGMMLPFAMGQGMRDHNEIAIGEYKDQRGMEHAPVPAVHHMSRAAAEKWVHHMHGEHHHGEMWSYDDAKHLAKARGIPAEGQEMVDFYAVLNMVYTDFCKVAKDHGVDTEDFYADLACAWLYDRDALPAAEKLASYYTHVIPHKEG